MFAFPNDMALDPFVGSGSTSLAAKNLGRNSVGYEINPEFIEIARQKLNTRQPDFMGTEYEFLHDTVKGDVAAAIEQLSWQFKDPHKLDKKTDPRKLTFGSRIEKQIARLSAKSSSRSRRYSAPKKCGYPTG
jgi:modification methylase